MDPLTLQVIDLGLADYVETWEAMKAYTNQRTPDDQDQLWCVEHPPVFTLGQAGRHEHLLDLGDIPLVQVDRGGQVTYHGPGQLVIYPLLDLRRRGLGARELVHRLERALIDTLASVGITAFARADAPGVYVQTPTVRKIASLGLRIRRGCSFHGLSLNVDMDMSPFRRINPCGMAGLEMTQVRDFIPAPSLKTLQETLCSQLAAQFETTLCGPSP